MICSYYIIVGKILQYKMSKTLLLKNNQLRAGNSVCLSASLSIYQCFTNTILFYKTDTGQKNQFDLLRQNEYLILHKHTNLRLISREMKPHTEPQRLLTWLWLLERQHFRCQKTKQSRPCVSHMIAPEIYPNQTEPISKCAGWLWHVWLTSQPFSVCYLAMPCGITSGRLFRFCSNTTVKMQFKYLTYCIYFCPSQC